jgi:putative tryptophan/tyrosine transport system substrate-binding protein
LIKAEGNPMRRRDLLALLGAAPAFWPLAGAAQQPKIPTVGVLVVGAPGSQQFWQLFREDLRALGYVEGQNIRFDFRSDEGQASRLPELAAELVHLNVDLIVTWFTPAALAAKQATNEIPIVMAAAGDPVATGLVRSLARPGGNVTGMAGVGADLAGKCVELIRDMLPPAHRVAALVNAPDPFSKPFLEKIQLGGAATGTAIEPIMIHSTEELDAAFPAMEKDRPDAVIVQPSLPTQRVTELALKYRIPAVSFVRAIAEEGGLMTYSSPGADAYQRAAVFVDKILKGAKPADLPVEQPTRFELVINMKTAKALGLTIPPAFLARADEVIE